VSFDPVAKLIGEGLARIEAPSSTCGTRKKEKTAMGICKNGAIAAIAVLLLDTSALAAAAPTESPSSGHQTSIKDFGKLSQDGMEAIHDIGLARLAIFDGKTAKAKSFIKDSQTALGRAKTEDVVFTKAEADLKPGPGMTQTAPGVAKPSTTPVAWIPVNGQMALDEDYIATPEKAAGVAKANGQIKRGEKTAALDTLKLADIDVYFVEEVAPLEATISGVDKAAELVDSGHYYEANQALKSVEDGIRFDSDVLSAKADKAAKPPHA